jgi:hypothetical protein
MTTVIKGQLTPEKIERAIEDFNKKVAAEQAKKSVWQFWKNKKQQQIDTINFIVTP